MVGGERLAGVDGRWGHRDGTMGGGVRQVSVAEGGRQGLVELEARVRICVGGVESGGLIEQEVALWRAARGGEGRGSVWKIEMEEDGGDDGWVGEKGEDGHLAAAGGAEERQDLVDASEQDGPADPCGAGARSRFGIGRSMSGQGGVHGWE